MYPGSYQSNNKPSQNYDTRGPTYSSNSEKMYSRSYQINNKPSQNYDTRGPTYSSNSEKMYSSSYQSNNKPPQIHDTRGPSIGPTYSSNSETKSSYPSYNSKLRSSSVANKPNIMNQGNNILRTDSRNKIETPLKEDRTPKYNTFSEPKGVELPVKPSQFFEVKKEPRVESRSENRGSKGLVGFRNLGNTCFMNSILQCLVRLPSFSEAMEEIEKTAICPSSKLKGGLAMAFKELVREVRRSTNFSVVSPYEVKSQIGCHNRQFLGYDQQDSAEFFRCLLEGLNIDLNRVSKKPNYQEMTGNSSENIASIADRWWNYSLSRDNSLVTDFFQGQLASIITCQECKYGSVSCDSFLCLNLPSPESYLRQTSLQQCLELYFKESHLQSYRCEKCKKKDSCNQKISLFRFPPILVLQLKRFHVDGFRKERLQTEISYPEEISLNSFKNEQAQGTCRYKLHGISHHIGSLYSGHYIADCKHENRWYCFDDSRVSPIDVPCKSTSAYLLFYVAHK